MLLLPVPPLSKLHHLTTREEWGTLKWEQRVLQPHQQETVQILEGPNTWGKQYLWPFQARGAFCHLYVPEARNISGSDVLFPEFILNT